MFGYIYETTNLINGKKYIGKHKSSKFDNIYFGSGIALKRALNKYGKENFKVIILEEINTNQKDLDNAEIKWIETTNAVKSKNYYNSSYGGENEGWSGVNKAVRENPKLNGMYGKHHTDKTKHKIEWKDSSKYKERCNNISNGTKIAMNDDIKKHLSEVRKNNLKDKQMIWINNKVCEKWIDLIDLNEYITEGYIRGRLKRVRKEK